MSKLSLKDVAFLGRVGNSAFVPPDSSNLTLWLKPESLSALNNNDPVATWPDSSGNANDFTQSTAGNKPLYKTGQINGFAALDFDGTDDFIAIASALGVTQSYSAFLVFKFDNAVPASGRECPFKNGEGFGHCFLKWDGIRNCFYNTGTFMADAACTASAELWTSVRTSAPLNKFYVNGVNQSITNSTAAMTNPDASSRLGLFLLGTAVFDGKISEVMLWKTNLSDADRGTVETYLIAKYAL